MRAEGPAQEVIQEAIPVGIRVDTLVEDRGEDIQGVAALEREAVERTSPAIRRCNR